MRRNEDTSVKIRFFIRRICASQKLKMRKEAAQEWRIIMEKVLKKNKNGMAMLMLFIALYVVAIAAIVSGAIMTETAESAKSVIAIILIVIGVVYVGLGWIFFLGLKVLKPQEALVLTLFGKYVGTIKEAGFYYVNPFCTAVNPAAETKLNQSGDVAANNKKIDLSGMSGVTLSAGGNAQMTNYDS